MLLSITKTSNNRKTKKKEFLSTKYTDRDIHTTIYLPLLHRSTETKGRVKQCNLHLSLFLFFFFSPFNRPIKRIVKKNRTTEKSSTSVVTSQRQFNLCACVYRREKKLCHLYTPTFISSIEKMN
jgi:hypothetical protein